MAYKYYFDRNKAELVVINNSNGAPLSGESTIDVLYSPYPEDLTEDNDEPEMKDHFQLALVHGVLYKLLGDSHQEKMYRKLIADARASSKNSSFMQVAQYDY